MLIILITGRKIRLFLYVKDEWVMATGTTLGADDGIGIAAQMAILTDKDLKCRQELNVFSQLMKNPE